MQTDQGGIYDHRRKERLDDTDDGCLLTDLFQLGQAELITHGEGDKSECDVGNDTKAGQLIMRNAETGYVKCTEQERTDQNTGNQVCGNSGKLNLLCQTGKLHIQAAE